MPSSAEKGPIPPRSHPPRAEELQGDVASAYSNTPRERIFGKVEKTAGSAVHRFFNGISSIRRVTPNLFRLLPWEQAYFDKHPEAGDPKKRATWRALKEKGEDGLDMYVSHLQDTLSVPEKLIERFADQATTLDNELSWRSFDGEMKRVLRQWVERRWSTSTFDGLSKGILSSVVHNQEGAGGLIAAGGALSYMRTDAAARHSDVGNELARMGLEFRTLLQVHYASHQRSLAQFTDFPPAQTEAISERIFTGSRLQIESIDIHSQARAVASGVGMAQIIEAFQAESLPKLIANLVVPAVASAGVYWRLNSVASEKAAEEYMIDQEALFNAADQVSREVLSRHGRGISVNLDETGLPARRKSLVRELRSVSRRKTTPTETAPWIIMGSASAADQLSDEVLADAAPLVSSLILVGALYPFRDEFTRHRFADAKRREIGRLERFADAIDTAPHVIPTYDQIRSARQGAEVITTRDEVLQRTRGPLAIHQIDAGPNGRDVFVEEPLVLYPGISLVEGGSGQGKSELLRILALEQGKVANIEITKGDVDLRNIDLPLLSDMVYLVEEQSPQSELTVAEQLVPFIVDPDPNRFKTAMKRHPGNVDTLIDSFAERPDLLEAWISDPYSRDGSDGVVMTRNIINSAFDFLMQELFNENSVSFSGFLNRKPGSTRGTSTGEAKRWELFKALLKERPVILLDEPTANLDAANTTSDPYARTSSYDLALGAIENYMSTYHHTVMIIASNDPNLRETLLERQRNWVGEPASYSYLPDYTGGRYPASLSNIIYPTEHIATIADLKRPTITWHAKPFRSE